MRTRVSEIWDRLGMTDLEDRHSITEGLVVEEPSSLGKGHFTGQA